MLSGQKGKESKRIIVIWLMRTTVHDTGSLNYYFGVLGIEVKKMYLEP